MTPREPERCGPRPPSWLWALAVPLATLALGLTLHTCGREPARVRRERQLALVRELESQLEASAGAEKSASLATTAPELDGFVSASKAAGAELDATRAGLRAALEQEAGTRALDALRAVDSSWAEVKEIDGRLLPMVAENTNRRASELAATGAMQTLERFTGALASIEREVVAPETLRALSDARASAVWIQARLAPHIASPLDGEMTAIEARLRADIATVDGTLASLEKTCPPKARPSLAEAKEAWAAYQGDVTKILQLSRANSNVHALELSLHEKQRAVHRTEQALDALSAAIAGEASPATR